MPYDENLIIRSFEIPGTDGTIKLSEVLGNGLVAITVLQNGESKTIHLVKDSWDSLVFLANSYTGLRVYQIEDLESTPIM